MQTPPIIDPEVRSFLLHISPIELTVLGTIIGLLIAGELTYNEQNVVGNVLQVIGQVIETVAAQGSFIQGVEQKIQDASKVDPQTEIDALKKKVQELEAKYNKQIKME